MKREALSTLAACLTLAALPPAEATITAAGLTSTSPTLLPIGAGDLVQPDAVLRVGRGGLGTLDVNGASFVQVAQLSFGTGASGNGSGNGSGLFSGAGTRVELIANGAGAQAQRLLIGNGGNGNLTVSDGATLDTSTQYASCLLPAAIPLPRRFCRLAHRRPGQPHDHRCQQRRAHRQPVVRRSSRLCAGCRSGRWRGQSQRPGAGRGRPAHRPRAGRHISMAGHQHRYRAQ